jgi:ribosomal protein S18 acetylase RimI-like enzyme
MRCIDLSSADEKRLYDFYLSLPQSVHKTFMPFKRITNHVIREHLVQTEAGLHISMGLVRPPDSDGGDGAVVGHGFIMGIKERHPVFGLGICETEQGRGWGRRLAEAVLARAEQSGIQHITLTVVKRNTPALTLYKSLGFAIAADHTFLNPHDSYLMVYKEDRI